MNKNAENVEVTVEETETVMVEKPSRFRDFLGRHKTPLAGIGGFVSGVVVGNALAVAALQDEFGFDDDDFDDDDDLETDN